MPTDDTDQDSETFRPPSATWSLDLVAADPDIATAPGWPLRLDTDDRIPQEEGAFLPWGASARGWWARGPRLADWVDFPAERGLTYYCRARAHKTAPTQRLAHYRQRSRWAFASHGLDRARALIDLGDLDAEGQLEWPEVLARTAMAASIAAAYPEWRPPPIGAQSPPRFAPAAERSPATGRWHCVECAL